MQFGEGVLFAKRGQWYRSCDRQIGNIKMCLDIFTREPWLRAGLTMCFAHFDENFSHFWKVFIKENFFQEFLYICSIVSILMVHSFLKLSWCKQTAKCKQTVERNFLWWKLFLLFVTLMKTFPTFEKFSSKRSPLSP